MKTVIGKPTQQPIHSQEAAKAALMEGFENFLDKLSQPLLMEIANHGAEETYFDALQVLLKKVDTQQLSPQVRNQIAYTKGKALSFENIKNTYELLDSKTVCEILGISRQALNKRVQAGQVIAYTEGTRKHYPAFQFKNNAVIADIGKLTKAIAIDSKEGAKTNVLLGYLAQDMDFSNLGEPQNLQPRYTLLSNKDAFEIIVRDFQNRLTMGK
ncbi:hypothetical protein JFV28_21345 [Pseudomonas sp. TH05]|uniref:hypothetical protein n=1 Tax=unclassified Pseudomonas TaxID=196821 RepID=UPI0019136F88|nr:MULTISPECIES: hypothetical protein [unclassified Pseudomonas]MBK5539171.1 hypothetical protein [Pseudomonas sp. TH07]MBK5558389.1 hypothetical protein [Pseudomonas sp. TH05]